MAAGSAERIDRVAGLAWDDETVVEAGPVDATALARELDELVARTVAR